MPLIFDLRAACRVRSVCSTESSTLLNNSPILEKRCFFFFMLFIFTERFKINFFILTKNNNIIGTHYRVLCHRMQNMIS